jgi:16S rRNA A1518/A1519 N6-dimethyltransferase RsmA/KsgA/DIM1 with predicted DNA glycosylase/AP lyase activity
VAGPNAGLDYRAMNLEVTFYSQPVYLFEVDRTAFIPAPNVDGAVVKFLLRPRQQWPLQTDLQFLSLVSIHRNWREHLVDMLADRVVKCANAPVQ